MYSRPASNKRCSIAYQLFIAIFQHTIFASALYIVSTLALAEDNLECPSCGAGSVALIKKHYLCNNCLFSITKEKAESSIKETELSYLVQKGSEELGQSAGTLLTEINKALPRSFADLKAAPKEIYRNHKCKTGALVVGAGAAWLLTPYVLAAAVGYLCDRVKKTRQEYLHRTENAPHMPIHLEVKPLLQSAEAQLSGYESISEKQDILLQLLKNSLEQSIDSDRMIMSLVLSMAWGQAPKESLNNSCLNSTMVTGLRRMTKFPDNPNMLKGLIQKLSINLTRQEITADQAMLFDEINNAEDVEKFTEKLSAFIQHNLNVNDTFFLAINPVGIIGFHKSDNDRCYIYNTINNSQFSISSAADGLLSLDFYVADSIKAIASMAGSVIPSYTLFQSYRM